MTSSLPLPCSYHVAASTRRQHRSFARFGRASAAWWSSARGPSSLFALSSPTSSYTDPTSDARPPPGFSIVEEFYACLNRRDFDSIQDLIAEDCVYEDLVFQKPFLGRKASIESFEKFMAALSSDMQVVIDDISREDPVCVGVTWHLEWNGKPFPFSKGCSLYRLTMAHRRQQIMDALPFK